MRYHLRTLLIVLAVGPPVLAGVGLVVWYATWGLADVLPLLLGALYMAAWVAIVIAWRWAHRPPADPL
jgi:hypothetical protein